jgi:hypothetical protein
MANYPLLAATLAALNATKNDPQGSEAASKIDDALRQTRNWMYDYLSAKFDATTNLIKAAAFDSANPSNSIPAGLIRGSAANGGAQQEIRQGTVSDVDLRDKAVTSTKLANDAAVDANRAVGTDHIKDGAVTGVKIGTNTVEGTSANSAGTQKNIKQGTISTPDLRDKAVDSVKLASDPAVDVNRAVTEHHIRDGAVTRTKIGQNQVEGDRMIAAPAGYILVGGNTVNGVANALAPKQLSGDLSIDANGVVTLGTTAALRAGFNFFKVAERASAGLNGGGSLALTWNQKRGTALEWIIEHETVAGVIGIDTINNDILFRADGSYLIFVTCPAYAVGHHKCKIIYRPDPTSPQTYEVLGSNEYAHPTFATTPNVTGDMGRSWLIHVLDIRNATQATPAKLSVHHWTELAIATFGLGIRTAGGGGNAGLAERYATVDILRIRGTTAPTE